MFAAALLDWSTNALHQLHMKLRKLLTMNGVHHIKGDIDHLHRPRNLSGRGFTPSCDVECERCSLSIYLHCATEPLLHCARNVLKVPVMSKVDDFITKPSAKAFLVES